MYDQESIASSEDERTLKSIILEKSVNEDLLREHIEGGKIKSNEDFVLYNFSMQLYSKKEQEFDIFEAKDKILRKMRSAKRINIDRRGSRNKENERGFNIKSSRFRKSGLKLESSASGFRLRKKKGGSNRGSYIIKGSNSTKGSVRRKKSSSRAKNSGTFGEVISLFPDNMIKSKDKLFRGSNFKRFKIMSSEPTPILKKSDTRKRGFKVFATPNLPQKWKRTPVSGKSHLKLKMKKKGRVLRFN